MCPRVCTRSRSRTAGLPSLRACTARHGEMPSRRTRAPRPQTCRTSRARRSPFRCSARRAPRAFAPGRARRRSSHRSRRSHSHHTGRSGRAHRPLVHCHRCRRYIPGPPRIRSRRTAHRGQATLRRRRRPHNAALAHKASSRACSSPRPSCGRHTYAHRANRRCTRHRFRIAPSEPRTARRRQLLRCMFHRLDRCRSPCRRPRCIVHRSRTIHRAPGFRVGYSSLRSRPSTGCRRDGFVRSDRLRCEQRGRVGFPEAPARARKSRRTIRGPRCGRHPAPRSAPRSRS